jgi:sugar lactone lactonase YvrE
VPGGVAVDASGKIYVAANAFGTNAILIYAPAATGDVAPIATISGPHTQLSGPVDVKLDARGNIYASNSGSITEYAAGSTGDATPIATITGPNTGLGGGELAIDTKGRVFTTSLFPNGLSTLDWGYFAAGANGNVAPVQTFKDPCQFCGSTGIAVDGAGTVYTDAEFTDGTFVFRYPVSADGTYSSSNVVTVNTSADTFFLSTAQIAVH